ncbi:hypothetical protein ACRAR1_10975 [Streptomyces sanyensis]|uniref:hypothetical protein n=1 Tax=Streptomyces sanyensis TaxID=568869 RepID=UPI003D788FAE
MPDRRHRTDLLLPRERQSTDEDNPFAPPPEGRADQPWQPRRPSGDDSSGEPDSGEGSDGSPGRRGRWSDRQPGRSGGGFGGRPGGQRGGAQGPENPGGLRWDPTDPVQRRARYALLGGMWAFFFAVFRFSEIALLLGALALYWGISSLRAKPSSEGRDGGAAPGGARPSGPPSRPQTTAAISGLAMAGLALLIVAASFTAQLVYRDYYTCVNDALTKSAQVSCNDLLPEPLQGYLGVTE